MVKICSSNELLSDLQIILNQNGLIFIKFLAKAYILGEIDFDTNL